MTPRDRAIASIQAAVGLPGQFGRQTAADMLDAIVFAVLAADLRKLAGETVTGVVGVEVDDETADYLAKINERNVGTP